MVEIVAREQSGDQIAGAERLWLLISHPPYTNLFDALNFVGWALVVCYAIFAERLRLEVLGPVAVGIALVAMGEAGLVSNQTIEPLVPALQSYWILIHVAMLFISYSLFTLGAACALLQLWKSDLRSSALGAAQGAVAAVVLLLVGGGSLLTRLTFEMTPAFVRSAPSRLLPGRMLTELAPAHVLLQGASKASKLMVPVAGVGPLLLASVLLLAAGAIAYGLASRRKAQEAGSRAGGFMLLSLGAAALTFALALIGVKVASGAEIPLPVGMQLVRGEHGPLQLALAANYGLGLIVLCWASTLAFLITAAVRTRFVATLPDPRKLEDATYRLVVAGWPLLTVGIVMGGMWANEAWGRFWGWDPKETWALITWVVYAGYLHARITLGWTGKRPAIIAVAAFAVVVFTFMGVNLGLTGDGLHSYGAG
jgi:cytochrome c-type biogenesis protein CcsB